MAWTPIYPGEVLVDQDTTSRTVTAPETAPSGATYKIRLPTKPGGNFLLDSAKAVDKSGFRIVSKWIVDAALDYAAVECYLGGPETAFFAGGLTVFPSLNPSIGDFPDATPQEITVDVYVKFDPFAPGGSAWRTATITKNASARNIGTGIVTTAPESTDSVVVSVANITANSMWFHLFLGLVSIPGQTAQHVESYFSEVPSPQALALFGAPFDGFDRGVTVEIERNIRWIDTLGGVPVGLETGDPNGSTDSWRVRAAFSVQGDKRAAIESVMPPYGTATTREIVLPRRFGLPSFPGLGPDSSSVDGDLYDACTVRGFSSNGQRGVVVYLYDYELELEIACAGSGNPINDATPVVGTAPDCLARKFRAHQINDFSVTSRTVDAWGTPTYPQQVAQHGRRVDWGYNLDHLTIQEASEVTAFFRSARANRVMIAGQYYKLLKLSWNGGAGPWWDGTLEAVKA